MKKDSNMFNDNSTETEGIPADKTAEIPKVVDSTEEENAKKPLVFFGREFSRKQVCVAGAGILCAALLIGGGGYAIAHAGWAGKSNTPAVFQKAGDEKQDMALFLEVKAEGWGADTSTPVIAHIEGADGEVDFYTAIAANKKVSVTVGESGIYNVSLIPPVNADGSTYKAASSEVAAVKTDGKTDSTVITLEKVDTDKVAKDDLTAIAKDADYPESYFLPEDWAAIQTAYTDALAAIQNAETSEAARAAQLAAMGTIRAKQSAADQYNVSNLASFRNYLNSLPEDLNKLDKSAESTIKSLIRRYEQMTGYQRDQLMQVEKTRYAAIKAAYDKGLKDAVQYQLKVEYDLSGVPEADRAGLQAMITWLKENTTRDGYSGGMIGNAQMAELFTSTTCRAPCTT